VQAFCRRFGFTYLHTPFARIEHTSGPDEVARWEATFHLGSGYQTAQDNGRPVVPLKTYARSPALWFQPVTVALQHAHDYTDAVGEDYDWFRQSHAKPSAAGPVRVAVHIRRGDVSASQNATRFTPDEQILAVLDQVGHVLNSAGATAHVHIYSQGAREDFIAYEKRGAILHLENDALADLLAMSEADLLIIGKSSFSYVAGVINPNIVLYEPFWHAPQRNWIAVTDQEAMGRKIKEMTAQQPMPNHS
jgi:hypothetical protein